MPVEPTDPEHPDYLDDPDDLVGGEEAAEFGVEAPEADAAEQQAALRPPRDTPPTTDLPEPADEADRAEQARVVELDEDDYR
ncbi:hypothetical protein ADL22_30315 [Streptomyces sp. NRRL F-4489]|uniref:hypothetical protein n=1 Tax=Streptomyces sp. NRRL F-4489 TaxID=1609095 RepID=UPI00074A7437|nr:hypothetical protein [Streptomyces sp. NRRL F-4489]KUL34356.1 hypothetical protein ADL22_30315 [Streptomyces sp. NRRL F-4489]